ncbi:ABC transporter ATP-binding protein [Paenibacillus piri]|uniref:ABC transporter ATP-binding protein n=1 Tax=Paenibacillus piri TaxID=2547395 RepID=A0A4R5KWB7_9BACL|nr:ABC transporter ATP-binding protein [Paenibacillus piri]TDG00294.1 ABC transporter ATP-binding protein [Paenibacillus piri]
MHLLTEMQRNLKQYLEISELRKPLAFMLPYAARYWKSYAGLVLLLFGGIGAALFFTWFLQNITDAAVKGDLGRVRFLIIVGICSTIVSSLMVYANTYLSSTAIEKVKRDLKNDLFAHMLRLPTRYYGNNHSGELVSHLTNDVNGIEGAIGSSLLGMLRLPLMAAAAFIYLVHINWQLSLLCMLLVPLSLLSGAVLGKLLRRNSRLIHDHLGKVNSFLGDAFAGQLVIRSFTLEQPVYRQYEDRNQKLLAMELKVARLRGWFSVGAGAAGTVAYLLSMGLGAYFVTQNSLTVGSLLAFVSLMQYLISPLAGMAGLWGGFQRSIAAIERLQKVMNEPAEPHSLLSVPASASRVMAPSSIHFHHVTFGYDSSKTVLDNFSLTVPVGKAVALVGPSGAGKSTLFSLAQRFYRPDSGTICLDQQPIELLSNAELRSSMAYVPQETYLFAGTIRDNIAFGRLDASESEIVQAAKDANAHEFILALPHGYDTETGERGVKLSGGQKQRIAIARAVLKNAPILLLDEATSALDSETEYLVQEALERLMKNRTTMVIAHRLSTIQNADLIVVMDQGAIVEQGKHHQLLNKDGLYARLYRLQFEEKAEPVISKAGNA